MPVELRSTQQRVRLDVRRLRHDAERMLDGLGYSERILSILVTDDRQIEWLHLQWMGLEGPTDVMSFPMDPGASPGCPAPHRSRRPSAASLARTSGLALAGLEAHQRTVPARPPERALPGNPGPPPCVLGDIVISAETAARRRPRDPQSEVIRYLIHGLLHLVGYDHRLSSQRVRMNRQAQRLQKLVRESS